MPISLDVDRVALMDAARDFGRSGRESDVSVLGEGQLSIALCVDGFVLRFPRSEFARGELRREVSVLEAIRGSMTVPVPEVVAVNLDRELGRAFVAHRLLPGETLTPAIIRAGTPEMKSNIAEHVATFLREFHAVPLSRLPMILVRSIGDLALSMQTEVDALLAPRMSAAGRRRAEDELLALGALEDELNVPCASDIGGNIVYDASSRSVSFIDFGDTMISDPVLDVASLSALDDELARLCGALYPIIEERLERAHVVKETFVLQDMLYGARQADWDYVDSILRHYDPGAAELLGDD